MDRISAPASSPITEEEREEMRRRVAEENERSRRGTGK